MKIGDRIFVHGYIDEIRKDTVIVRNDGGYFGTIPSEVMGELPSAQPERKKGKWDFMGWQMFQCSECKHTFTQDFLEGWKEYTYESHFPPFCPNCGADMREGEEE